MGRCLRGRGRPEADERDRRAGKYHPVAGRWILTGVFINRNFINTVNTAGNAMVDKGGKIVDLMDET